MKSGNSKKNTQSNWIVEGKRFLTDVELRKLLETASRFKDRAIRKGLKTPVKDWFLICVAAETGMRIQEITNLKCGDIQHKLGRGVVIVRKGKGGKPREIYVRKHFMHRAREYFQWKQDQGENIDAFAPVFSFNGKKMNKRSLQRSYDRTRNRAQITQDKGVGIHSIRHTYATFLLEASNGNLRMVQNQLGHSSIQTTEVYTHVLDEQIHRALDKLYA
ncbi:tyrosine-type recombinase/integrase [Verrucomicrobiota bacterium]